MGQQVGDRAAFLSLDAEFGNVLMDAISQFRATLIDDLEHSYVL